MVSFSAGSSFVAFSPDQIRSGIDGLTVRSGNGHSAQHTSREDERGEFGSEVGHIGNFLSDSGDSLTPRCPIQ